MAAAAISVIAVPSIASACAAGDEGRIESVDVDVVVVGAGAAGLGAAHTLAERGQRVVVVEARDRIGGRMWTDRSAMSIPVERGAELVHGALASTWPLVNSSGAVMHEMRDGLVWEGRDSAWGTKDFGDNFRVIGGYDQILQPLATGLTIALNTVVRTIEHSTNGVVVHAERRSGAVSYNGRACVVTLPAAVLRTGDVEFLPALPSDKVTALHEVPYEQVCKVLMEFAEPVLPDTADFVEDHSNSPAYFWNASADVPNYRGQVVVGWSYGPPANEVLALPTQERYRHVLEVARAVTGRASLEYVHATDHDWAHDPYARGAYPVQDYAAPDAIYRPVSDVLFWAGIVTDQIDLSYSSGVKTAGEVLKR